MLINLMMPIPIKSDDVCSSLIASGHAVPLPPLVDDIADPVLVTGNQIANASAVHLQCGCQKSPAGLHHG